MTPANDLIYVGATWRRELRIADESGPISPGDLAVLLSPATVVAVTETDVGAFEMLLTDTETKQLAPASTFYEVWGTIAADRLMLARVAVQILGTLVKGAIVK